MTYMPRLAAISARALHIVLFGSYFLFGPDQTGNRKVSSAVMAAWVIDARRPIAREAHALSMRNPLCLSLGAASELAVRAACALSVP
jgi:hypothetical protein